MRARREKEKTYYLIATAGFLMALACVFTFLQQFILVILLFAIIGLITAVGWSKRWRLAEQEIGKILDETDFSSPLRRRDFLTMKAWVKMASRWGVWKTVLLTWVLNVPICGGLFFIQSLLDIISMTEVVIFTIIASIGSAVGIYWGLSKAFVPAMNNSNVK